MSLIKLETRIERIEVFLGINHNTKSIPKKLQNIDLLLKINKIILFFKECLDIDIYDYLIKSRKRKVTIIKHLFMKCLIDFVKVSYIDLCDTVELKTQYIYDRSNMYYINERHGDYMIGYDTYEKYYQEKRKIINNNLINYLNK